MTLRIAAATLLLVAAFSPASLAKDAKLGEASIALTTPAGQCELDPKQAGDARMLQITTGALEGVGSRLLAFYADCKQLADWRTGKRPLLEDFSQYQTAIASIDAPAPASPDDTVKQICAAQRQEGEKALNGVATDIKSRIEEAIRGVTVNQMRFLGVVAEEQGVCYAALAQRFKAETGKDVTLVSVYATTFVKGKLIHYYLYSPYRSAQTVASVLAKHKINVSALLQANKKMARGPLDRGSASRLASSR
jgi:hypothetical protein